MSEDMEYTVEKILAHISFRDAYRLKYLNRPFPVYNNKEYNFESEMDEDEHCHYLYLIKWAGYPEFYDCWEPERNFLGDSLLRKYKRKHNLPATHSKFKLKHGEVIFKYPLTRAKWEKIPAPQLRSSTLRSKITTSLNGKKFDEESSRMDVTPALKIKKRRQIITSDDEDDVVDPPVKMRVLGDASMEFGPSSSCEISKDLMAIHPSNGDLSSTTANVFKQNEMKDQMDQHNDCSPTSINKKTESNITEKRKKQKRRNNLSFSESSCQHHHREVEKKYSTTLDDQQAATHQLVANECLNYGPVHPALCDKIQDIVPDDHPTMEDLFGENDSVPDKSRSKPLMEMCSSSVIHSDQLPATTSDVFCEKYERVGYINQSRDYNREIVLTNLLSSRRCTSSEDLLKRYRKEYQIVKKQSRIANYFAGIIKKVKLHAQSKLDSECRMVEMKNEIHVSASDESKKLAAKESEIAVDCKNKFYTAPPPSVSGLKLSPIKKVTLCGVAPIVMKSAQHFIKSLSSCAQLSQLLKLVIAFLNTNSSQLAEILWKIVIQQRVILLKGLIENFMMYLHGNSLINSQPYQYLIMAETANSSFTVGSKVPECCGSGKYPHWKCDLLKVILRSCSEFSFGEDDGIFPSTSLVHCLQYGSLCLQCLFAPVAPLGVGFADIGRFKIDSNILPLLRSYNEKNFVPLLLQNGFDPNGLITDSSEQAIFNISDVLQDLKIDEDNLNIMNEHSKVLLNYTRKRLEFALVNHPNLTITDALTLPHVLRSGMDSWMAKYAEIYEDSETAAKHILTLHKHILDEDDLSSKNILFLLSLNPVNMAVSTTADCDLLLGESSVPLIVTPAGSTRYKAREVLISISNQSRKRIRFHSLTRLSSGCDQYFIMESKDKSLLKPGKVDIQVCLVREDNCGIVTENSDKVQSFIVQLFVVSRKL